MKPAENSIVYERELATIWFDAEGILCSLLTDVTRTVENTKKHYEFIGEITNHQKICVLADTTLASPLTKEVRDYTESQQRIRFKAMAVISHSQRGEVTAKLYLELNQHSFPIAFFDGVDDARLWLRKYL